jgi:zona occludens toxin (predicted ATPase)
MYRTIYRVIGRTQFPDDMLRYDHSQPASDMAVILINETQGYFERRWMIEDSSDGFIHIDLVAFHKSPTWAPTITRWHSCGWSVIPGSVKTSLQQELPL